MLLILLTIVVSWVYSESLGYLVHRLAHWKNSNGLYDSHLNHHITQYPPGDFYSTEYRDAGADSLTLYFLPFIAVSIILAYLFLPLFLFFIATGTIGIVGFVNNFIHNQFHLINTPLNKFLLFRKLRFLHMYHHEGNMRKNFGITAFWLDRLFKTYKKVKVRD